MRSATIAMGRRRAAARTPWIAHACRCRCPRSRAPMAIRQCGEVGDLRLARGVDEHGLALGQRRRHQQVLGGADRDLREDDVGALQPVRRAGVDVAFGQLDLGAQLLQPLEVQVDRPRCRWRSRRAATPWPGPSRATSGPSTSTRGAHLAHHVVGRGGAGDARAPSARSPGPAPPSASAPFSAISTPCWASSVGHGGDVGQMRHVGQGQRLVGQQRRRHQRQGRVLGAADRDAGPAGAARRGYESCPSWLPRALE